MNQRELFFRHQAPTSFSPPAIEIDKAEGVYIFDASGKKYIDLIAGISVSNVGHRHPKVMSAIDKQLKKHLHVMVYGEYIQSPQVKLAEALAANLPESLNSSFFVNSGSEAVEGALKLAKRVTGRTEIISFKNAYHGSSHGALSVMGDETLKQPFRPLLPNTKQITFNAIDELNQITNQTACVIIEPIQGEAGIRVGNIDFIQQLKKQCDKTGTLLIFDEIQTGFGRTGKLFAFEHYNIAPDILCLAKGMGGGMPIGTFIASKNLMDCFAENPALGHISTFGGHPVSCAAALACIEVINETIDFNEIKNKQQLFIEQLNSKHIKEVRGEGLLLAAQLSNFTQVEKAMALCADKGLLTDWFLFCDTALRIAPPLTITEEQIITACDILNSTIDTICKD